MPCRPNRGAVSLDAENGDFIKIRASGTGGGGLPKFAVTARDPNEKRTILMTDNDGPPFVYEFPEDGSRPLEGRHRVGFAALYETCVKYQLEITVHRGGSRSGSVLKKCSWDQSKNPRAPRAALRVTIR